MTMIARRSLPLLVALLVRGALASAAERLKPEEVVKAHLAANDVILRDGLLGGVLNAAWPLLALEARAARVSYEGLKKLDGRDLHRLCYRAKKGQNDLDVLIYLEPDTWRRLATVYTAARAQNITGDPITSSQQVAAQP